MFKVLIKDIIDSRKSLERPNQSTYLYYNGREVKLFAKGSEEKSYKRLTALKILRSLYQQGNEISTLSIEDASKLRAYVHHIWEKKSKHSHFIQFLSKLQNILL